MAVSSKRDACMSFSTLDCHEECFHGTKIVVFYKIAMIYLLFYFYVLQHILNCGTNSLYLFDKSINNDMKKFLLALVLMVPMLIYGQDVKIRDMNALGMRIISASGFKQSLNETNTSNTNKETGLGGGIVLAGLNLTYDLNKPSVKTYKLNFSFGLPPSYKGFGVARGSRLLLKLKSGVNLTLKSDDSEKVKYDGSVWGYSLSCIYKITKTQLNQIIKSGGVSKLRFELTGGSLDITLDEDFYKFIKEADSSINETLTKKDTFDKDF